MNSVGLKQPVLSLRRDSQYTTTTQTLEFLKFSFTKDYKKNFVGRHFWQFLIKLNVFLLYDLTVALLGIYQTELKTCIHKKTCTWMIIIAKSCNQPRCPSDCVSCSIVSDSAAPWAVALQAPLSTEFSRQDYWKVKGKVAQLSPTLSNPMDYTVHGILQARILEWVAFPFSTGCSQHRDHTQVSKAGRFFTS